MESSDFFTYIGEGVGCHWMSMRLLLEQQGRGGEHRQEQWSVGAEGAGAQSLLLGAARGSSSVL